MKIFHTIDVYEPIEDVIQIIAFEFKRKYGRCPDFGMRSGQLYKTWKRLGRPAATGGGSEPVGFLTLTFGGWSLLFEDPECSEFQVSVETPDAE